MIYNRRMPEKEKKPRGRVGATFAGLAAIAVGLACGWLLALRIEPAFFRGEVEPVGPFVWPLTGRAALPEEVRIPEGTEAIRLRLFSLRELLITLDNGAPLLEITYKQDGERGWLYFTGDPPARKRGGVIPPPAEALPAAEPVLDFTFALQPTGPGLAKLTITEKQAVRPVQLTIPASPTLHFYRSVKRIPEVGVDYGPPVGEIEIGGVQIAAGHGFKRVIFRWATALLAGLIVLKATSGRRNFLNSRVRGSRWAVAKALLCSAAFIFILLLICERLAFQRNRYLENRDPSPELDTWNLIADTDLGKRHELQPKARSSQSAVIGWLGSSSTFGSGLASRFDSFPVVTAGFHGQAPSLQEQISKLTAGYSPEPETMGNRILARPGYGALQLYLAQTAPQNRHLLDVLVFYFGGNAGLGVGAADYYLAQRQRVEKWPADSRLRDMSLLSTFDRSWELSTYAWLFDHSHLFQWLLHRKYLRARSAAARVNEGEEIRTDTRREMRPSHEAILWGLAEYCRRNNILLVLVPELNNKGEWINPWYAELMKRTADKYDHVDFIDLAAKIKDKSEAQNWFVDYVHPNELGHQKFAEMLWEELQPIIAGIAPYTGPYTVEMADGPTIDELLAYQPTTEQ